MKRPQILTPFELFTSGYSLFMRDAQANKFTLVFLFVNLSGSKAQLENLGEEKEKEFSLAYRTQGVEVQIPENPPVFCFPPWSSGRGCISDPQQLWKEPVSPGPHAVGAWGWCLRLGICPHLFFSYLHPSKDHVVLCLFHRDEEQGPSLMGPQWLF